MTTNTTITLPPGARRTRCPKCTTLHTEPSTAVYKCPTCSTLLLARHRSTQANNTSVDGRVHELGMNLKHVRLHDGEFKFEDSTNASSKTDENKASGRSNIKFGSYGIDEGNTFDRNKGGNSWQNVYEHKNALLEKPYEGNPKEFQTNHSASSLNPSHRRSSYSSIASTGSSGNHLGRHFSGIGSASFTGSETGVFSPLWSSAENMDIPEADLLNENSRVLNNNNNPHIVDSKDGNFIHTRRHGENAWLSRLADASESHADTRTNTRRRLDLKDDNDGDDDYDPRKLVSSFSRLPCSDTKSKYCSNNETELSFRIQSVNNVCPSLVEDMGVSKKKGYYLSSSVVSGSEQSSNSGIDDSETNDMDVKIINDSVVNDDSWRKSSTKSTSEAGREKRLCQFNKSNVSKDLCIDQGIPYYQNGKTYMHDTQKSFLRMSQSQGNASHFRGSNINYSGSLLNQDANFMPRTFSHQIHSMNATNDQEQGCAMTDNSILQGLSYGQHCSDSSKFPCEKLNIMHRNGYEMPLPTSHKNDFSPYEQRKQISQLSSMPQDDDDDDDHYHHRQYRSNIPVNQNQVEYCHMKRMGNSTLFQIKERTYPPFPGPGASPYVLCRYCCKILQIPTHLHVMDALQKLKCSACGKTSKFNVVGRDKNPPTFRQVSKKDEQIQAPQPNYGFQEAHKIHGFDEGLAQNGHSSFYTHGTNQFYSGSNLQHEKLDRSKDGMLFGFHKSSEPDCEMGSRPITSILEAHGVFDRHWRHGEYDGDGMQRNVSGAIDRGYVPSPYFNSSNGRSIPVGSFDTHGSHDLTRNDIMKDDMAVGFGFPSDSSSLKQKANGFAYKESDVVMVRTHLREMQGFDGCSYTTKNPMSESIETTETEKRSITADTIPHTKSEALAVPPGSPLIEHFFNDSSNIASSQDLINVIQAPEDDSDSSICSPAPGSPLFRHLSYDSMLDLNRKNTNHHHKIRNVDNIVNAPNDETSFRGVSKGPKDLARLLRKGISELGKVGQTHGNRQRKVVVNGHIIPDTALKRVETRAGLMHPGTYWYDYRAGFWGVMGGPCLGIVPPLIEELNFPLARDCSGGDTSILVNGRELHEEDLLVLSNRGLPTTQGKSYTLDINGHVVDTTTSEQVLQCRLGRLAPSMERRGRGYGMFQPSLQC